MPREFGGPGARWPDIYETIRQIARVDSALAHLLGFTCLQVVSVNVWGNPEQRARYLSGTVEGALVVGQRGQSARHATRCKRNQRRRLSSRWAERILLGHARLADDDGFRARSAHRQTGVRAWCRPTREGITVHEDWNPIGQRQTDSGSVSFVRVKVEPHEVLERADTPYASLRTLISQQVLTNLFVGIAQGALEEARAYVTQYGKPWIIFRRRKSHRRSLPDPALRRDASAGGECGSAGSARRLCARRCMATRPVALDAETRAHVALATSEAKIVAHRAALDVSEKLFDACGARATHAPLALDRFWRNARVHTLHDPLDYRVRDVGRYALSGTLPEVSLYT